MLLKIWYFSPSYGCCQEREKRTELSQVLQGTLTLSGTHSLGKVM